MNSRLVLASGSPRRRELLAAAGVAFDVIPSTVDEAAFEAKGGGVRFARRLALAKALDVARHYPGRPALAADTAVVHRREILGKPGDAEAARQMLARLRGRRHSVVTAITVVIPAAGRPHTRHAITRVTMRRYADSEIEASIARGDPFDKAGGYAIQDPLLAPVVSYDGCYCNVVGLPLWTALALLAEAGIRGGAPAADVCRSCPLAPIEALAR